MIACPRRLTAVALLSIVVALVFAPPGAVALPALPEPVLDDVPVERWSADVGPVSAEAWVLTDLETGQIVAGRAHLERRSVASTIKILTALSVVERVGVDDVVTVGEEVLGLEGAGVGLVPGDIWTVGELLDALISRSGNDAAEVLAVHVGGSREAFVELMRTDAAEVGLDGVEIVDPSGLEDGNLLSASDLARLGAAALQDPILRELVGRWSVTLPGLGAIESRNALLWEYPGATGVKTGFTEAAGSSLIGSARQGGRELIAVVLASEDDRARFLDAAMLLDHGFAATDTQRLGSTLGLRVGGGIVEWTFGPALVVVPRGATAELALPIPARPAEGEITVAITVEDEQMGTLTALASDGPGDAGHPGATLGRAVVDGVYAALRTAAGGQALG